MASIRRGAGPRRRAARLMAAAAAATAACTLLQVASRNFVSTGSKHNHSSFHRGAGARRHAQTSEGEEDAQMKLDAKISMDEELQQMEPTVAQKLLAKEVLADIGAATPVQTAAVSDSGSGPSSLSSRLRSRLKKDIEAQKAEVANVPTEEQKWIQYEEVDLNGIDAPSTIIGAFPTAALSFGCWVFTSKAAEWFVTHPVETEFYPLQRFAVAFSTAIVGLGSLAAGIFGFTALGILLLGLRVLFGNTTGELDPNKKSTRPERQSTFEKTFEFMTKDPVDMALARKKAREEKESVRAGGEGGTA